LETKLKMVYWKGEKFWVCKLIDHPEVMTQGKTLKWEKGTLVQSELIIPKPLWLDSRG